MDISLVQVSKNQNGERLPVLDAPIINIDDAPFSNTSHPDVLLRHYIKYKDAAVGIVLEVMEGKNGIYDLVPYHNSNKTGRLRSEAYAAFEKICHIFLSRLVTTHVCGLGLLYSGAW